MIGPPVWVTELVGRFWDDVRRPPPPFPRDLERVAAYALRVSVIRRRHLRVSTVGEYLQAQRLPPAFAGPDRPLRGALYCWAGVGFTFLDPTDPPDEQRFSFAHELAHFLRDYAAPRRQVERSVGHAALEVLDGRRPPSADERVYAVLRNRPLTPHCHFMSRDPAGRPEGEDERRAEADADRLAFELLAPAELFHDETDSLALTRRLVGEFGLPASIAGEYARLLLPPPDPPGGLFARLKQSL
jgi:hypothetical protein